MPAIDDETSQSGESEGENLGDLKPEFIYIYLRSAFDISSREVIPEQVVSFGTPGLE